MEIITYIDSDSSNQIPSHQ